MLQGWVVIAFALGYIGLLFVVASYGDRTRRFGRESRSRLFIYPLSLAIYCTSWTFFGSVGLASRTGFDFLTIYLGPILMMADIAPGDPNEQQLVGDLDVFFDESGFARYGKYSSDTEFNNTIAWAKYAQGLGKGFMDVNEWQKIEEVTDH